MAIGHKTVTSSSAGKTDRLKRFKKAKKEKKASNDKPFNFLPGPCVDEPVAVAEAILYITAKGIETIRLTLEQGGVQYDDLLRLSDMNKITAIEQHLGIEFDDAVAGQVMQNLGTILVSKTSETSKGVFYKKA